VNVAIHPRNSAERQSPTKCFKAHRPNASVTRSARSSSVMVGSTSMILRCGYMHVFGRSTVATLPRAQHLIHDGQPSLGGLPQRTHLLRQFFDALPRPTDPLSRRSRAKRKP
jgi:hypothetical protein